MSVDAQDTIVVQGTKYVRAELACNHIAFVLDVERAAALREVQEFTESCEHLDDKAKHQAKMVTEEIAAILRARLQTAAPVPSWMKETRASMALKPRRVSWWARFCALFARRQLKA